MSGEDKAVANLLGEQGKYLKVYCKDWFQNGFFFGIEIVVFMVGFLLPICSVIALFAWALLQFDILILE